MKSKNKKIILSLVLVATLVGIYALSFFVSKISKISKSEDNIKQAKLVSNQDVKKESLKPKRRILSKKISRKKPKIKSGYMRTTNRGVLGIVASNNTGSQSMFAQGFGAGVGYMSYGIKRKAVGKMAMMRIGGFESDDRGFKAEKNKLIKLLRSGSKTSEQMTLLNSLYPNYLFKSIGKEELKFINTVDNNISTFSIDVDNGAYSQIRNYIKSGNYPPKEIVRTEEMVNYFHYDYPKVKGKHPVNINTELGRAPWNKNHYLLQVGLKAKEFHVKNKPKSNLVFLIDVSGSMEAENKLPLLKKAFLLLARHLDKNDRVSIVVYAGSAGVVLNSAKGSDYSLIKSAINNLSAGGSTAGGEGIMMAYRLARKNFIKNGNNRVILATDGDFNVGVSSDDELIKLIKARRDRGIFLTILGFGNGNYKDKKMEALADKGNGNYYYIDNYMEAKKVLSTQLLGTMFTVAKDLKLQLEFNPKFVKRYRLIGYENRLLNREDFNNDKKDAGEMGAGHTVTAFYEMEVNDVNLSRYSLLEEQKSQELVYIKLRYKEPNKNRSKLLQHIVYKMPILQANSKDFRFACSVIGFSELLQKKDLGNYSFSDVEKEAYNAKGDDKYGYRAEFINLVRLVKDGNLKEINNINVNGRDQNSIINKIIDKLFSKSSVRKFGVVSCNQLDNYLSLDILPTGEVENVHISIDNFKYKNEFKKFVKGIDFGDIAYGKYRLKIGIKKLTPNEKRVLMKML